MNIGIILAGGTGSRLGYSIPKQFYKVAGKTVIEHTIDTFEQCPLIDEIAVVVHPSSLGVMEDIILKNHWAKVKKVLKGGKERYDSSLSAIAAYADQPDCNMIFHDAVRPLLTNRIIEDVIHALEHHNAVDVGVPATDTIIQTNGDIIEYIPDRTKLMRGQTPQGFKWRTIQKAYEIGLKRPDFISTDDCGTVVRYLPEEEVYVVTGEESNMKLTYKEDTYILDKLFQLRSSSIEQNIDFGHLKDKVLVVFGGNSGIGEEVVKMAEAVQAKVYSFSRSSTQTDISDIESVKDALKSVNDKEGRIDYVVNSAAILAKEPLINMDYSKIDQIIHTNYNGMVNVALAAYPYLAQQRGGLLLYTSSSYTRGRAFYSLYSSTKAAVVNFAQAIAQEWEPVGIHVNVINPERTKTPMRICNFGIEPDETLLKAEEVAEVSLKALLSDFTGQVIDVKIKGDE